MDITFLGAAREVTGSCSLLQVCGKNILVDYGMEQGANIYENTPMPIPFSHIDCVLLTHAHIDHSGKLPYLVANGFRGRIYATGATKKLCEIMLRDSAHIQEADAEWKNRKAKRAGEGRYVPLYTMIDAEKTLPLFMSCDYKTEYNIYEGVKIRFIDAGHLLGSASIEVVVTENGVTKKLLFSGDVGNVNRPLIRDPALPDDADIVVVESTYGDRTHGERPDYTAALVKVIQSTLDNGGNVVIPSFAVGRTQEMLYLIRDIKERGLIKGHDGFPVWVDSPLANEATKIYAGGMKDYYDENTLALVNKGINVLNFDGLRMSVTTADSVGLNADKTPKVIISSSGMCEAGRIKHHLKHNLWRAECTVLFVGYQAEGTLGRIILDGAKKVTIFNEDVAVNAHIEKIEGISGHADKRILLKWLGNIKTPPERVFVNHGNDEVCENFAMEIKDNLHLYATAPYNGGKYDLVTGLCENVGNKEKIDKTLQGNGDSFSAVYQRLQTTGQKVMAQINATKGHSNKEMEKMTKQLADLLKKWENS